jgi:hypothetical protein
MGLICISMYKNPISAQHLRFKLDGLIETERGVSVTRAHAAAGTLALCLKRFPVKHPAICVGAHPDIAVLDHDLQ